MTPPCVQTTVDIVATPEQIYDALVDLEAFASWNPFVIRGRGKVAVGETLELTFNPPGGSQQTFTPKVMAADRGKEFRWLGVGFGGGFRGEHKFLLEKLSDSPALTRLHHSESFGGWMAHPLGWVGLYDKTRNGFELMNQALKERLEKR
jgi:hypothetical protein